MITKLIYDIEEKKLPREKKVKMIEAQNYNGSSWEYNYTEYQLGRSQKVNIV